MMDKAYGSDFHVEIYSEGCLWLKKPTDVNEVVCTISSKEIQLSGGKGVLPMKNIRKILAKERPGGKAEFRVYMKENKTWNENMKKKHPVRWRLGLITKSKPKEIMLGVAKAVKDKDILIDFFREAGICVESVS
ncbi:hypothetical protein [Microbulbifer sp. TRSA005]|uniref:hypothetical protein n=1 Tax=unclassified Microbulbifer TaxID=2619833 RepID=UPI004039ECB9